MKTAARLQASPEKGRASGPFFKRPVVQAKLRVSRPGDAYERQADHAADAVVHGRGPLAHRGPVAAQMTPLVHRAPADDSVQTSLRDRISDPSYSHHEPELRPDCPPVEDEPLQMAEEEVQPAEEEVQAEQEDMAQAEEEEVQTAPQEVQTAEEEAQTKEEEDAQMRAEAPQRPSARATRLARVEGQLRAARGKGNPLPEPTRRKMEAGLGADLSGIRIHTDTPAALMTQMLNAKAFASGRDIFFSPHRFAPGTTRGDHLIAHEVAHTLQQAAVPLSDNAPAQRMPEGDKVASRPESLRAIGFARQHIGKINTKMTDDEGNRLGWQRLLEIFRGAFDGDTIDPLVIKKPIMKEPGGLPHWCGIFAWSMLRKAGFPLPPWKLGVSILPHVGVRPKGKLPEKGDIAYRKTWPGLDHFTHHQALVTGVESVETAAGKAFDEVMIRTVDGNTAGNDNLGGQVEEKWLPARLWDHFFDPTAKVSLPDVPLIVTDRSSDDLGGEGQDAAVEDAAGAGSSEEQDVSADEAAPDAPPPGPSTEGLEAPAEDVAVDLPPVPDASVEPPAVVEQLSLGGAPEDAATTFLDAAPSQMAATAPVAGSQINARADAEKSEAAKDAPVLKAETGGEVNPEITQPGDIPIPTDTTLGAEGQGPETGDLKADPYKETGTAPSTADTRKKLKKQPESGFLDWLKNQFSNILNSIRTSDGSINTSAGPRERVALTGKADIGQMGKQRGEATDKLRNQRDDQVADFRNHPGQSNIQPRKVSEERTAPVSKEPAPPIEDLGTDEGVADYATAELPKQVRDAADSKLAPEIHGSLADARTEVTTAASTRDAERDAAETKAEADAEKANIAADDQQRQAVLAGRTDVARQQGEAIGKAYDGVAEFATDANTRETKDAKKIREDVKREEGLADRELEKGEEKAKTHKKDEEKKAADKKRELKDKKEKQGLLDRAASFVRDVIDSITEALDAIFEGLRKLVKAAIDAAKEAAIGLINAARNAAITALEGFRDWAKDKVDTYVGTYFPGVANAMNEGIFTQEIVPVVIKTRKGDVVFDTDERPMDTSLEKMGKLRPAFKKDGTVTAGNASGINDAAAAVLLMSAEKAQELGLEAIVRIKSFASGGLDPAYMGLGPVPAIKKALKMADMTLDDIDMIELNEAFAAQAIGCMRELGIENDRPNELGSGISLGHPIGCTGARQMVTGMNHIKRQGYNTGLISMCIGGGMGMAMIVEK